MWPDAMMLGGLMDGWRRREFLRKLARLPLLAGLGALVTACGDSSSSYGSGGSSGGGSGGTLSCSTTPTLSYTISSNHGHTACIPQNILDGTDGSGSNDVTLTSGNGHIHTITLTDAEVTQIKNRTAVVEKTTTADGTGHSHTVTYQV